MNHSLKNRMKGKVDVWWQKTQSLNSNLIVPNISNMESYLGLPFRNRMKGIFDILAPERKVGKLYPIHDTFASEKNPYSIYGNSNNILVGYSEGKKYEGLLKFNLQELFPSYSEDAYILIDSVLKLTISNVRDIKDIDLNFYEVSLGNWNENSTTWANKPIKSNILASTINIKGDESETGDFEIYIDIGELIYKWLNNPQNNNGIIMETKETINNIISIYSKENGNENLNPQLLITYIDLNSPFVTKNKYLHSVVSVWENKTSSITSELEVEVVQSTKSIASEFLILNKPGDLLSSLEITRDRVYCELDVVGNHIASEVTVYSSATNRISNTLNVRQINMDNEIKISKLYNIENELIVGKGSMLQGFLGINANRLVNDISFKYENNIISEVYADSNWRILNDITIPNISNINGYLYCSDFLESRLTNILNISDVYNLDNHIYISSINSISNYLGVYKFDSINNIVQIINDIVTSDVNIIDVNYADSVVVVQGWTLSNYLDVSCLDTIQSNIDIPRITSINNNVTILNEIIENQLNVYIKKNKYLDSEIYVLATNNIYSLFDLKYESSIYNEVAVYVDKISVLYGYLEIINEDWEYHQRKGYGYIM